MDTATSKQENNFSSSKNKEVAFISKLKNPHGTLMELKNFKLGSYGLKEFPGVFSRSHNYILCYQIMES